MIECETTIKKWGNSVGLVIPKEDAESAHLKPNQKVRVMITPIKQLKVGEIFGQMKGWKKPTKTIMEEVDRDLDS